MKDAVYGSKEYQEAYLPWANDLMNGKPVIDLASQVQSDRNAIISNTALFQPPLNQLTAELELPMDQPDELDDKVKVEADFEMAQLAAITISSLNNYFVALDFKSDRWPVRYGDSASRKIDRIAKNENIRERTEMLVVQTSAAMLRHMVHRVPIGIIPEEAYDWSIEEGELERRTLNALRNAGIDTYGDLGILSVNQLLKIEALGKFCIRDIKKELFRLGWLSSPNK